MRALPIVLCVALLMQGCVRMVYPREDSSDGGHDGSSSDARADGDSTIDDRDGDRDSEEVVNDRDAEAEVINPSAASCREIFEREPSLPSGEYTISVDDVEVTVFCDMVNGGWTQVVRFDATAHTCPGDWVAADREVCIISPVDCAGVSASAFFESPQGAFAEVRGFIRAYQYHSTDAFLGGNTGIGGFYVDGVSITYGRDPRRHIWTLASGLFSQNGTNACPCLGGTSAPDFVGSHYYCDSGNPGPGWEQQWYDDDPLWDDGETESCETLGSPAWFERNLDSRTSEAIEVRILQDGCDENIGIYEMELYVR